MSAVAASVQLDRAPADTRRATRRLAAVLIPVGPLAVAFLRFVLPYFTAPDADAVVKDVMTRADRQSLVVWLGFIALLTLVPGVLWVGRLTRRRAPKLTAVALLLAVPGYLSLSALLATDTLLWVGVNQNVAPEVLAGMYEALHPSQFVGMALFVLGHVIGTILLGIALWRSRAVPAWAAIMTIVAQPLHFVAAMIVGSPPLDLAAWGLNAIGFAAASVAILRLPDDDWDAPPELTS